jgi:putative ubiquitin-RnfH superfamily antitoxin RatB of RatAB toxin-antitoxin module
MLVEIVFALPGQQVLLAIDVGEGATVADVIARSGIARRFAATALDDLQAGIWGRPVDRDHVVTEGDRVELYRPLQVDPKEARRSKAGI